MWQIVHDMTKEEQRGYPKIYCLGFAFTPQQDQVLLILKNKPEWQKGLYNGVGGKVEDGEAVYSAMAREFQEETGIAQQQGLWTMFCSMIFDSAYVVCFRTTLENPPVIFVPQSAGDSHEIPSWFHINELPKNRVENAGWLVPMAMEPGFKKIDFRS